MRRLLLVVLLLSLPLVPARADEVYTFVVKKQEDKVKSRWSLQDWLDTRDRMRLMDLWLAMNSPSPYEFFIGGNYQFAQATGAARYNAYELFVAAYAHIFGLEARYEKLESASRLHGLFNLRLFGFHAQATNLTLQLGLRQQTESGVDVRNAAAGASMTIYLGKYFGIDGLYRRYFASVPGAAGARISASRFEAGAFIDFKFLRVYGTYFNEPDTFSGAATGLKLFF